MPIMNISLTPELENFVNSLVGSGMYSSASEVVRAGLRLLRRSEELHVGRLRELRGLVAEGVEDLEYGRSMPLDADEIKTSARKRRPRKKGRAG